MPYIKYQKKSSMPPRAEDNCAKWILRIGELQDVTINLRHLMDFGEARFTAKVLNTDQIVHNMDELLPIAGMLVR